jgi:small-conductance mechanosensitive channel
MRLLVLFALLFLVVPIQAQEAAPAATPADELIRILEDDTARQALIETLRQAVPEEAVEAGPVVPPDLSIARQLAEYTRSVAEGASASVRSFGKAMSNFHEVFTVGVSADAEVVRNLAINLSIVVVGLIGSFWLLRLLTGRLTRRIAEDAEGKGLGRRLGALLLVGLIDVASIIIAWALGYVLALNTGVNPTGQMGINQSLLLNAFLIVEASKLAIRLVLAPRHHGLRFLPVGDENAAYWSFWAARLISLVGYTFMFVAPMLNSVVSRAAGGAVQILVMATAVTIAIIIVLQNKQDVRNWLAAISERRNHDGLGRLLAAFGQHWHVLAIAYLVALLVVWFANPDTALPFMLGATIQSLIAIGIGSLVVGFIGRFVSAGLSLPDDVRQRLPLLESRLRAFVPGVMSVVRWVVIVGVIVAIGQAWALFDFVGWIGSDEGLAVAGSVVSAALIVLVAIVLHVVVASWVEYRLNTKVGRVPTSREKTLLNLFKNAFTVALAIFALMLALAQIGVNIAPLLAGAGVVGLAIGFGAQKLVQDIITGIFIQFENVMNEGDAVEVAGRSGTVEKLTIRSVTIRDMSGTIHLIPFSSVDQVSNMVRGFSFYVAEVEVAYDSDIEAVKQTMRDAFEVVLASEHANVILDDLDPPVLVAFTQTSMKLRARIKTLAGKQWGAGRLYSETVWRLFAERDIRKPTPRVSYVPGLAAPWGADEGGN